MNIFFIIISLFVLLFAITVHEAAHGWAAYKMGDPTAYALGRVTLNPIAHIDPIGTVLFPFILVFMGLPAFGWAKPVPVNPINLRNPRRDNLWISAAGPAANLIVSAISLFIIVFLKIFSPAARDFLIGFLLGRGGLPPGFHPIEGLTLILFYCVLINTYLAVFNLIPIPPLDGSGILMGFLSEESARKFDQIRPFGFLIILGMIYLGLLHIIIRPIEILIYTIILF